MQWESVSDSACIHDACRPAYEAKMIFHIDRGDTCSFFLIMTSARVYRAGWLPKQKLLSMKKDHACILSQCG